MLTKKQILEYAIKGVSAEISELEKTISQGKRYLMQYEKGEITKLPKTQYEMYEIMRNTRKEIEKLSVQKVALKIELSELK